MSEMSKNRENFNQLNNNKYPSDQIIKERRLEVKTIQKRPNDISFNDEKDDNDEEPEYVLVPQQANRENMDKISDIVIFMIFKNKINQKNAFDVPFPNVEKLSDFKSITSDVSWNKLSQALGAGAKIYGVDYVHTETFKVLGGLQRTELLQENSEVVGRRSMDSIGKSSGKKKTLIRGEGENTIEKNLSNITTPKYDLEFDIDPLFQKTSSKFDEAGAKGLLLNTLWIDNRMNLMFDSESRFDNYEPEDISQKHGKYIGNKAVFERLKCINEQILKSKICPELTDFKETYLKESQEFFTEKMARAEKIVPKIGPSLPEVSGLKFEDINVDADQILKDLGAIVDGEFNEPKVLEELYSFADYAQIIGANVPMMDQPLFELKEDPEREPIVCDNGPELNNVEAFIPNLQFSQPLDLLVPDYRNWMSPHSWKTDIKKPSRRSNKKESKRNRKEQETWDNIFTISLKKGRRLTQSSLNETILDIEPKKNYLLPINYQIKPLRLLNLFSRKIESSQENVYPSQIPRAKEEQEERLLFDTQISNIVPNHQDLDTFDDVYQNLETMFGSSTKIEVQPDKLERYINIKILKKKMWEYMSAKLPNVLTGVKDKDYFYNENENEESCRISTRKHRYSTEGVTFTEVCKKILSLIDPQAYTNLPVHSLFVAVLHLANEKNLKFEKLDNDFIIFKEPHI